MLKIALPTPLDCFTSDDPNKSIEQAKEEKLLENLLVVVAEQLPWAFRQDFKMASKHLEAKTGLDLYYKWEELNKEAKARIKTVLSGAVRRAGWLKAEITTGKPGPETVPHLVVEIFV